jgi:hypothetical protein
LHVYSVDTETNRWAVHSCHVIHVLRFYQNTLSMLDNNNIEGSLENEGLTEIEEKLVLRLSQIQLLKQEQKMN